MKTLSVMDWASVETYRTMEENCREKNRRFGRGLFGRPDCQEAVEISIIDKHRYHTMLTELHEVAGNRVEEDSIRISLSRIFAGRNVRIITDTIESIDYDKQVLKGADGAY